MGSGATKRQPEYPTYDYKETKDAVAAIISQACREFELKWTHNPKSHVQLSDFMMVRTLGTGAFGRVMLVQHKLNRGFYAVKILDKDKIVKMKQVEHTLNEKKILATLNFPFLVKLDFSFQDNCNCFIVLEFVSGGEMFTYLRRVGRFSEQQAKVYTAQVVLAFEYLHTLNILYRDLKPENILIDSTGFLKVTDMGFAKRVVGRTYTLCGTPEYLAPEIIMNKGYGKSVDWWTLGILIYEMNAGYPPFSANEHMTIYEKIYAGKYKFPRHFSDELKDLCRHFIQADLTRRFGILKDGVEDIKAHSWFTTVNWLQTIERKLVPMYIPRCKGPGDPSNFMKFQEEELKTCTSDRHAEIFKDF